MDMLKREIERKKQALQEAKQKLTAESSSRRRFVKTIDLRRVMEENQEGGSSTIFKVNDAKETSDADDIGSKSAAAFVEVDASSKKTKTEPAFGVSSMGQKRQKTNHDRQGEATDRSANDVDTQDDQQNPKYKLTAVISELRQFGLPVTLFGETLTDRLHRLKVAKDHKAVVQLQATEADEFRLGQGHGIRNPFLEKDEAISSHDVTTGTEFMSANSGESKADNEKDQRTVPPPDDGPPDPHKRIYRHFKDLLKQWEADLQARPEDLKRSLAGRNETKKVKQCKDYIRPLFQLCKRRQLEENLLNKLDQMVQFCEEGEFVRAHDAYLDVAIGRAAWPIGVTMVGIHARTGRAKIESANVAHVMNSELQRKYLTSVKRLLTYEQSKRPDVDPSKKVR
jgi:pre-mRNA-splicing factor 18